MLTLFVQQSREKCVDISRELNDPKGAKWLVMSVLKNMLINKIHLYICFKAKQYEDVSAIVQSVLIALQYMLDD